MVFRSSVPVLFMAGVVLVVWQSTAGGASSPVVRAAELLARIEQRPDVNEERPPLPPAEEFAAAARELSAHLAAHEDDVAALLEHDTALPAMSTAREYVDRALALQPDNADASFWNARVLFNEARLSAGSPSHARPDLARTIRASRRATELAPDNEHYKETLAEYLILVPESAAPDPARAHEYSLEQAAKGRMTDDVLVRARVYVVYKGHFPSFSLGRPFDTERYEGARMAMYILLFERNGKSWKPRAVRRSDPDPEDGMVFALTGLRDTTPAMRSDLPIAVEKTYCMLTVQALRPVNP